LHHRFRLFPSLKPANLTAGWVLTNT
jgi:hypothetical protein